MSKSIITHESFIAAVAALATARLGPEEKAKTDAAKLVYGSGPNGTRGVTFFRKWSKGTDVVPFVEVSAFGQESPTQLAGTTIHELAHVIAGWDAGHGPKWKEACERLGLRRVRAAGTDYKAAMFCPKLREAIMGLARPTEGQPVADVFGGAGGSPKPCGAGVGVRGGKSRGKGSGQPVAAMGVFLWPKGAGGQYHV